MNFSHKGIQNRKHQLESAATHRLHKLQLMGIRLTLIGLIFISLFAGSFLIGMYTSILSSTPDVNSIQIVPKGYTTTIVDSEGNPIQSLVGKDANREYVTLDKIPENLQNAFIAIEDERFRKHNGVDTQGVLRALTIGIKNKGDFTQGASTITQQLLKNQVFEGGEETTLFEKIKRKLQEQFLALQTEKKYSKNQILEYYLNTINLGQNTLGVQAASKRYFNKNVSDLTLSECAVLAGITQNPSAYNPISHPAKNSQKRTTVLTYMKNQGYISSKEYTDTLRDPVYDRMAQAAENGKQVSVLVELKARFDEENNIVWAKKLEKAGCHVIYGLVGLKTHSKITLVVRKEEDGIRRYVHLGTGNYNDSTAKLYTDMGMFTSKTRYGEDATAVFNMLSGYSEPLVWNKLSLAPLWLRGKFLSLIEREKEHAKNGRTARIIAKMNSLCDPGIIEALYDASEAGVEIDLIVRGICCLRAGIKGLSEHIRVRSIVGTFLEHSRIFYFENNGNAEYYMGSADWMPRNLDKRVEILFPVEDPILQEEIYHILHIQLSDTKKAHLLMPDGHYVKVDQRGKTPLNSQLYFCEEAMANAKK